MPRLKEEILGLIPRALTSRHSAYAIQDVPRTGQASQMGRQAGRQGKAPSLFRLYCESDGDEASYIPQTGWSGRI